MADGTRFSFDLDTVFNVIKDIADGIFSLVRPVTHFIVAVSGSGWVGFALVFMIFFMIYLVRLGARTEKTGVYADGLHYIAVRGLLVSGGYLVLLAAEYALMPVAVLLFTALFNSLTSVSEPGLNSLLGLLLHDTAARSAFFADVIAFYGTDHLLLPLGFRATGLIVVAFGAMYLVAQGLAHSRSRDTGH